jgi:serine/threonine-protein kinase
MWRHSKTSTTFAALVAVSALALTGCNKVPDLTGKTQQEATDALTKAKLKVGQVTTASASTGKTPGTVIDQDPKPKGKVPEDKTVALVLEPGTTKTSGTGGGQGTGNTQGNGDGQGSTEAGFVTVPNIVGMTLADADAALLAVGLSQGDVQVPVSDQPAGKIFEQNPSAGKSVTPGQRVDVKIATNATVPVPAVIGASQLAAEAMIKAANLTVGPETAVLNDGPQPNGSVIDSNPKPGFPAGMGAPIALSIKQDAVHVPAVIGMNNKDAQIRTFQAGLTPVVSYNYNPNWPPQEESRVMGQTVNPNTLVARNSNLGLIVKTRVRPGFFGWRVITKSGAVGILKGAEAVKFQAVRPAHQ